MDVSALAVISLGSNLGDSGAVLLQAMASIQSRSDLPILRSSLWQTTPVACPPNSPLFVNAAVAFLPRVNETPESLLSELQRLETAFGRRPKKVVNEPRPLDLDLIVFGRLTRQTARLTLPHPRAHERRFVLQPISEIIPTLVIPGQVYNAEQLLARLHSTEVVCRLKNQ